MNPTRSRRGGTRRRRTSAELPRLEEVVVLGLAAARLARAVSVDEITEPSRAHLSRMARRSPQRRWVIWAERLVGCPLCVGWWTSLAVSLAAPGRHRLLRGVAVAGAQVVLALSERLISEEGRVAIHSADQAEAADTNGDGRHPTGGATDPGAGPTSPIDLAPHDA